MMNTTEKRTVREELVPWERWLELMSIVTMLVLFGFFVLHQVTNTGFFTTSFGPLEMFCLYGPMLFSLAAPAVRVAIGRRNPARPLDVAGKLFLGIASLWLLIVFPFNFAHLADVLPGGIQFLISWISDGPGRIALILQIAFGLLGAIGTLITYLRVRQRRFASPSVV
jgi:hypothetical protein